MLLMYEILLWIVFPYSVIAVVSMGLIWQCNTPRSPEPLSFAERILTESLKGLFILSTLSGIGMIYFSNGYAEFFRWLIGLALLKPDMGLILNISVLPKAHFIITLLFLLGLGFSKQIVYLIKPHLFFKNMFLKLSYGKRQL